MARVTVEDCVLRVPNRFELVMVAAQRVRQILGGSAVEVSRDHDKNTVIALREIADGVVDPTSILESLFKGLDKFSQLDSDTDEDESVSELIVSETSWKFDGHRTEDLDEDKEDIDSGEFSQEDLEEPDED